MCRHIAMHFIYKIKIIKENKIYIAYINFCILLLLFINISENCELNFKLFYFKIFIIFNIYVKKYQSRKTYE